MPAVIDLDLQRGNNTPVIWQFASSDTELFPLAGSEFVLTIACRGYRPATIRKDTATDAGFVIDEGQSTVAWTPTLEESRQVPCGRLASYELERRIDGTQRTLATGMITGVGGLGDD